MNESIKIKALADVDPESVIAFYAKFGDAAQKSIRTKLTSSSGAYKCHGAIGISSNGEVVGAYLGIHQALLSNPELNSSQSVDTLISPNYRGTALLRNLAVFHYNALEINGFDCVFGVPNKLIEKIRYKRLDWNMSRIIYRFIIIFPSPLLYVLHLIFSILGNIDYFKNNVRTTPEIGDVVRNLLANKTGVEIVTGLGCLAVIKKQRYKIKIGIIRYNKKISSIQRLRFLALLAYKFPLGLMISYATRDSETAQFLKTFSIRSESLHFSGRLLGARRGASFGEQSFEFLEYDTF